MLEAIIECFYPFRYARFPSVDFDVVVAGLFADFPLPVGGVGERDVAGYEASEDGSLMRGEGFPDDFCYFCKYND